MLHHGYTWVSCSHRIGRSLLPRAFRGLPAPTVTYDTTIYTALSLRPSWPYRASSSCELHTILWCIATGLFCAVVVESPLTPSCFRYSDVFSLVYRWCPKLCTLQPFHLRSSVSLRAHSMSDPVGHYRPSPVLGTVMFLLWCTGGVPCSAPCNHSCLHLFLFESGQYKQ